MVNTYFKRYSSCLAITHIQIKSVSRFHPIPGRVDLGEGGDLYAAVHTSDNMEIKPIEPPRGPAIPLPGMNPKDSRSAHYRNTCTSMLTATLCIPAKTWKQLRWPSTDEWINKV